MKSECKRSLYWHQVPGYTGTLSENPESDGVKGKLVFEEGKKYKIIALPYRDTNTLEYVSIYAVGEDGSMYCVMHQELHYGATKLILGSFDFTAIKTKKPE
ncbi:MAG: hypothetical protein WCV59_01060 [Parcubacteria group bacterium]